MSSKTYVKDQSLYCMHHANVPYQRKFILLNKINRLQCNNNHNNTKRTIIRQKRRMKNLIQSIIPSTMRICSQIQIDKYVEHKDKNVE